MANYAHLSIYGIFLAVILVCYLTNQRLRNRRARASLDASQRAGLTEPASLHPVINPNRCVGCGACVSACPEGDVLAVISGKADLINPTHCIGHGACHQACPVDAISLVFRTARRGVDIPFVKPNFETNIPGIFIAGELGGMGLIRNAVIQGVQAMEFIGGALENKNADDLNVLIVGAGPAGMAASLTAMTSGLRFKTVEQDSLGGAISHYPREKIVMTAPVEMPLVGTLNFRETNKEKLLEYWREVVEKTGFKVSFYERVDTVTKQAMGFTVKTNKGSYNTRTVLLAIGRRGTPRKLNVSGEELTKVVYQLNDPKQYAGKRILVVGGGDSALENANMISQQPDTRVVLSYRGEASSRAKEKNRQNLELVKSKGRLKILLKSKVVRIDETSVQIKQPNRDIRIKNDAVIVCAGGVLPTSFLKEIGVEIETKFGTA